MQRHGRLPFMLVLVCVCASAFCARFCLCVRLCVCVCVSAVVKFNLGPMVNLAVLPTHICTPQRSRCLCHSCFCCSCAYQCGAVFSISAAASAAAIRQLCAAHVSTLTQRNINNVVVVISIIIVTVAVVFAFAGFPLTHTLTHTHSSSVLVVRLLFTRQFVLPIIPEVQISNIIIFMNYLIYVCTNLYKYDCYPYLFVVCAICEYILYFWTTNNKQKVN